MRPLTRPLTRHLMALAVAAAVLATAAGPAAAYEPGGHPGPTTISAGVWYHAGSNSGSGGPSCTYATIDPSEFGAADRVQYQADRAVETSPNDVQNERLPDGTLTWSTKSGGMTYRYMWQNCKPGGGQPVWALIADPVNMALGAYEHLTKIVPEPIGTFQPLDAANNWAYVQVATDYRLPAWDPVSVRVEAGPFWATATATPRILAFHPGDPNRPGDVAACGAGGPVAAYDPSVPGDCSYTYLNSSAPAGGLFTYTFVLTWDVTFDSNVGPPLPPRPLQTDHTDTLAVAEARPVVLSN